MNINELLDRSTITTEVLTIVWNLQEDDNYTKEDAVQDLLDLLDTQELI
ncbi:hypothetical protein ACFQIC_07260 [Halobacillus seohaensis]|uniref:Uncharacterized protein n=1 Tax=Halobacillus seohaensis TaxID=447421 RepID=A0ABW2EJG2_9BACI